MDHSGLPLSNFMEQVAIWVTIAHLGVIIILGDTIIYDDQRQVTLDLKQ